MSARRAAMEAEGNGWVSPAASGVIKGQRVRPGGEISNLAWGSPGLLAPGRQGWAASVRSGSYRVVTVPTVRHAAHLPPWADRAVLLGHALSCRATD